MNFGTVVDGHNGRKLSKNRKWEIFVTLKKILWMFQLWPQISQKSASEKFLRFLAKSTKLRAENTNMAENRNRK